jgi:hypothetical protein
MAFEIMIDHPIVKHQGLNTIENLVEILDRKLKVE